MAKVLIVEGNPMLSNMERIIVTRQCAQPHTVVEAVDYADAEKKLKDTQASGEPFQVVLTDITPGTANIPTGMDLAKWIQDNNYPAKVVITSGTLEQNIGKHCGIPQNILYQQLKKDGVIAGFIDRPTPDNQIIADAVDAAVAAQQATATQSSAIAPSNVKPSTSGPTGPGNP